MTFGTTLVKASIQNFVSVLQQTKIISSQRSSFAGQYDMHIQSRFPRSDRTFPLKYSCGGQMMYVTE